MRTRFSVQRSPQSPTSLPASAVFCRLGILPLLLIGLAIGATGQAQAQSQPSTPPAPQTAPRPATPPAPPELTQVLTQIDAAANQHNLQAVMAFYSPNFTSTDGLKAADMQAALKSLWERYPNLTYSTKLNSWSQEGNAIVAETTTTITAPAIAPAATPSAPVQRSHPAPPPGSPSAEATPSTSAPRSFALTATLTSRQRFENQKIVQQEVLSERTQMTTGENPPTIDVSLPQQVRIGQSFDFDALVREPLGDRLLLGAALEEPIRATGYLNSTPVNLEPLSAGGIFKVGRAPITPESRWISAVIIRDDGITTVTQRLQVSSSGASLPPAGTPQR